MDCPATCCEVNSSSFSRNSFHKLTQNEISDHFPVRDLYFDELYSHTRLLINHCLRLLFSSEIGAQFAGFPLMNEIPKDMLRAFASNKEATMFAL